jgi:quinol monooxygenase YgiN
MPKVALFAKIAVQPGKRDEVLAVFEELLPTVEAEEGTELYVFHRDDTDENVIRVFELYTDHEALGAHAGSPAMAEAFTKVAALIDGAPEMVMASPAFAKGIR